MWYMYIWVYPMSLSLSLSPSYLPPSIPAKLQLFLLKLPLTTALFCRSWVPRKTGSPTTWPLDKVPVSWVAIPATQPWAAVWVPYAFVTLNRPSTKGGGVGEDDEYENCKPELQSPMHMDKVPQIKLCTNVGKMSWSMRNCWHRWWLDNKDTALCCLPS